MNQQRFQPLDKLAALGQAYDQQATQRAGRYRNSTSGTGPILALLPQAACAGGVLEIGAFKGYSTIWLADAMQSRGGHVTTSAASAAKTTQAAANFEQASFTACVTLVQTPAEAWLPISPAASAFAFLGADRAQYGAWWSRLRRPSSLLVVDNATAHPTGFAPLSCLGRTAPAVESALVSLDKDGLSI